MTDYNDGKWHGWNGGECPVHPESVVEGIYWNPEEDRIDTESPVIDTGYCFDWKREESFILLAFRVTEPYVEPKKPREVYMKEMQHFTLGLSDGPNPQTVWIPCEKSDSGATLFREVLP